jgi:hypothetical protein
MHLVFISAVALMFFLLVVGSFCFFCPLHVLWFSLSIYIMVALNCSFLMFRKPCQQRIIGNALVSMIMALWDAQFDADALIQRSWQEHVIVLAIGCTFKLQDCICPHISHFVPLVCGNA